MGVKMVQSSSATQATSFASTVTTITDAYQSLISAFQNLANASNLKGQGYESAKSFINSAAIPAIQYALAVGSRLQDAVNKIPQNYPGEVDSKDWSEEELNKLIHQLESQISSVEKENAELDNKKDQSSIATNNSKIDNYHSQIDKYRRIKEDLLRFNSDSAHYFNGIDSQISTLNNMAAKIGSAKSFVGSKPTEMRFVMPDVQGWNQNVSSAVKKYGVGTVSKIKSLGKDAGKLGTAYMKRARTAMVGGVVASNSKAFNVCLNAAKKDVSIGSFLLKHGEMVEQKLGNFSKHLGYLGSGLSFVDDLNEGHSVANATLKVGTNIVVNDVLNNTCSDIGATIGGLIGGPVGALAGIAIGYTLSTLTDNFADKITNRFIDKISY